MEKSKENIDLIIKLTIISLSLITPFIMIFFYGELGSISSYWMTPLQPLFILTNALTTYIFMSLPKWRLSALMLFLLTIFSVDFYGVIHNIFAILFFLVNLYPLFSLKKYRLICIPYILSCIWLPNLLWFEIQAIIILCLYHLNLLILFHNIKLKRIN